MMKYVFTSFLFLTNLFIYAQTGQPVKRTCATPVPDKAWNDWFNERVEEFKKNNPLQKGQSANYTIPVIFHVIHGGENTGTFPNISQAQINSQIVILNNDFAGTGFNVGNISNTGFSPSLIANCNVSFCLAEKDPSGAVLSEYGINRINYITKGWSNPNSFASTANFKSFIDNTVKPNTIWDPTRYLNIWVSDVHPNAGLLGYATFPPASALTGISGGFGTMNDDGLWCWAKATGDVGTLAANYNRGRTATHEVGHYLGLRHIWGDAGCGNDFCNDTPTQQDENTTCPTYPIISCNNGPTGDMFMNFMDYSYDACLYMFTNDQRTRIQTAMSTSPLRNQLTASASSLCTGGACSYTVSNFSNTDTLQAFRRATALPSNVQCPQGTNKAGYITGTNCYDDKEKAEFIDASKYGNVANPRVSGVIVLFFQQGNLGTDGNGNISLVLYSGNSANSQPSAVLGSVTVNFSSIAATTNTTSVLYCGNPNLSFGQPLIIPYKFNFANPVSVPQSGGFFASVVLPTNFNDTVSIIDKKTAVTNTAWEKWDDNTWHSMKSAWGDSQNFNLAILPIIECNPVGIEENSYLDKNIELFPNPSNGNFTIITNLHSTQKITVKVYSLLGDVVFNEFYDNVKENAIAVNMSERTSGVYFVEINNGEERMVKRLVLVK